LSNVKVVNIPSGTPSTTCKGCGATIYWTRGDKGAVPVSINRDLAPTASAPTDLLDGQGVNHFMDCPNRDQFKKGKKA